VLPSGQCAGMTLDHREQPAERARVATPENGELNVLSSRHSGVMALRNEALLLCLPLALLACGQVAQVNRQNNATTTSSGQTETPAPSPCVEGPLPPQGGRLSAPRDYPNLQTHLTVVETSAQPTVSAAQAFAQVGYQSTSSSCGVTEELAYWTSDTPATMPTECAGPDLSRVPAYCKSASTKPIYQHVLAWVFTWRTDCGPVLGPVPPPGQTPGSELVPARLSCTSITFVDATTGKRSEYTSQAPT
jgi:hypothetical protein